jgi:threonine/homoserine/homoserine lactone efflux protein
VPTASTLLTFSLASLALLLIPGPAVLYILNRSVSDGRRVGLAAVGGLELGNSVHAFAAALGLSAVLATSAIAFNTIKWVGVAYLVITGVRVLRHPPKALDERSSGHTAAKAFRQGIVVNIFNPKVALFFLSFLPQFIDPKRGHGALQALILGLLFVAIGCVTDSAYAFVASSLRGVLLRGRSLPFVQRYVAGTVFIGLGLVAAATGRARTAAH